MEYAFLHEDEPHAVFLSQEGERIKASVDGEELEVDVHAVSDHGMSFLVGGRSFDIYLASDDDRWYVSVGGESYCFASPREEADVVRTGKTATGETELTITAPMPGNVLKINVKEGEEVEEGQCLAIVEAMKMETGLYAMITGRVQKVHVVEGKQVNAGEVLMELEPIEAE